MARVGNKPLLTDDEVALFHKLYNEDLLPLRACADKLGYYHATLKYKLSRLGIKLRTRGEAISLSIKSGRRKMSKEDNPNYKNGLNVDLGIGQRWSRYGLSEEEFSIILDKQDNACAICKDKFEDTPHIDHCHDTGEVRGLLCRGCNHGLGNFRDNEDNLLSAINYLERARWNG